METYKIFKNTTTPNKKFNLIKPKIIKAAICAAAFWALLFAGTIAASAAPSYIITGTAEGEQLTVSIAVSGCKAIAGQFAIKFDETKLELLEKSGSLYVPVSETPVFTNVFVGAAGVAVTTPEANIPANLMSQSRGYALLAWYASGNYIDATTQSPILCRVRFRIKDGMTVDDFDNATLRVMTIDEIAVNSSVKGWQSGIYISANEGGTKPVAYRDTLTDRKCEAFFNYIGSDIPVIRNVTGFVKYCTTGTKYHAIGALVSFSREDDGREYLLRLYEKSHVPGFKVPLPDGTYTVRITKAGYLDYEIAGFVVNGEDTGLTTGQDPIRLTPGDSMHDGADISMRDVMIISSGRAAGSANAQRADINEDGSVTQADVNLAAQNYGALSAPISYEKFER